MSHNLHTAHSLCDALNSIVYALSSSSQLPIISMRNRYRFWCPVDSLNEEHHNQQVYNIDAQDAYTTSTEK